MCFSGAPRGLGRTDGAEGERGSEAGLSGVRRSTARTAIKINVDVRPNGDIDVSRARDDAILISSLGSHHAPTRHPYASRPPPSCPPFLLLLLLDQRRRPCSPATMPSRSNPNRKATRRCDDHNSAWTLQWTGKLYTALLRQARPVAAVSGYLYPRIVSKPESDALCVQLLL